MPIKPRDLTQQEIITQKLLQQWGIRYQNQYIIGKYTVDFFLPSMNLALEIDGIFGHSKQADKNRDKELLKTVTSVVHIKETDQKGIEKHLREALWIK